MGLYPPLLSKGLAVNPLKRGFGTYALEGSWNRGNAPALDNIVAWFQADKVLGLSNGDPIDSWLDWTTYNNDITAGVGGEEPVYRTYQQNGKPAINFENANDDYMNNSSPDLNSIINNYTTMLVMAFNSTAVGDIILRFTLDGYNATLRHDNVDPDLLIWDPADDAALFVSMAIPDTNFHIWYLDYVNTSTNSCNIARDGGALTSDTSIGATATLVNSLGIGGVNAFTTADILLAEAVVWNKVLSTAERALAFAYLNNKWQCY